MPHEKVDIDEYQRTVLGCTTMLALVSGLDRLPDVLAAIGRAEAVGPFLDPTLYRDKSKAMAEDKELLEAVMPLYYLAMRIKSKDRAPVQQPPAREPGQEG